MIKKEWLFMQTPKEKANRLVRAFNVADHYNKKQDAKLCAKIHINLMLENEILKPSNNQTIQYYQEVLKEIEKL